MRSLGFAKFLGSFLLVATALSAAAAPVPPAPRPQDEAPEGWIVSREPAPQQALQITTEDGICYVGLSAGDDGPVRLPINDQRFSALVLSTHREDDQLVVTVGGERGELEITPIDRFAVTPGPDGPQISRAALAAAEPWTIKLVPAVKAALPGCCSCSMLKINCCPKVGKCMGCGTCGECCN